MNRNILIAVSAAVLLGGFFVAARSYRTEKAEEKAETVATVVREKPRALERDSAMRLGDPSAKVVVVEFFDPACETCAELAPAVKKLVDDNPGRVQIVERYAPFHPGSEVVVAILESSRRQNLYWETLELLFSTQSTWASHTGGPNIDLIWRHLEQAGFDVAQMHKDMTDAEIAAIIRQDVVDAKALGVKATPEFFVNGKPLPKWGMEQLRALVRSELAVHYPGP